MFADDPWCVATGGMSVSRSRVVYMVCRLTIPHSDTYINVTRICNFFWRRGDSACGDLGFLGWMAGCLGLSRPGFWSVDWALLVSCVLSIAGVCS